MNHMHRLLGTDRLLNENGRSKHGQTLLIGSDCLFRHGSQQIRTRHSSLCREGIEARRNNIEPLLFGHGL